MSLANILLVEDDESLGFVIQDNLEQHGFKVDLKKDGQAGLESFTNDAYDLCVLDVMLPIKNGFDLAKEIRAYDTEVPIIFLTAKSMKADRIKGFKLGGDDYITKPFSIEELILRIEVFLKRRTKHISENNVKIFSVGQYSFNYDKQHLVFNENIRTLTQREAELLKLLIKNKNKTVSRDDILMNLWGDNDYFKGRSMDVFISRLRKYLNEDNAISIVNVHGVGFRLEFEKE